ncbi:MAG: LEPR-XLL domain-containing protein [Nitrospira sp. CG24E]|nr:MAG: LEPR-XLL domain-containing protein [Nitrospira sp. CG24E]
MKFKKLFARKKSNRREPRANAFVLESMEPRLLLSATPMTAAVVTTDHLDYAPGETAVITTSNQAGDGLQFTSGELVHFQVTRTDSMADYIGSTSDVGPAGNEAWYVTDGVGGFVAHLGSDVSGDGIADWIAPDNDLTVNSSISTTWFVEEQYRNSSLLVTAAGQESGAVATQAFTDVAVNTTTVLTSSTPTTIYGDIVTFTATVTAAAGTDAPTGTVEFWDGSALMGAFTVPDSTGVGTSTWSITVNQYLIEGPHPNLHAVFIGAADPVTGDKLFFNDSTSASITHTVTPKQLTASFTVNDKAYDGSTAATGVIVTLTGVLAPDDVSVVFSTATFSDANAGSNKTVTLTGVTLVGTERLNYSLASSTLTGTGNITAKELTVNLTVDNKVYDGTTTTSGVIATLAGVIAPDVVGLSGGTATFSDANAGSGKLVSFTGATLTGTDKENYTLAPVNTTTADIAKADATVNVSGYTGVYDAAAHGATGSATGVLGEDLSAGLNLGASFANAPGGTADWSFSGGTNYNETNGSVAIVITKANAVLSLTGYYGTYDGSVHQATGTATGVLGESLVGLNLSVTSHSNAGSYVDTVTFTDVTGNYRDTVKNVKSTISKANAVISLTGYVGTYDGASHQATGTATGVLGEDLSAGMDLSVTSHTNAGVYIDTVTFTDVTGNYKHTVKNVKSTINKANAVISLTGYVGTYDGAAHQATGTATGVLGEDLSAGLDLSVTSHTNAGTYIDTVTFTDVTGNYKNTLKNVKSTINKANAIITVTGYDVLFDGAAHTATGTATGVLGEDLSAGLDLSSTTHTAVGTYLDTVTFTDVTGNYKNTVKNVSNRIR